LPFSAAKLQKFADTGKNRGEKLWFKYKIMSILAPSFDLATTYERPWNDLAILGGKREND